jgi:hypothetical protein
MAAPKPWDMSPAQRERAWNEVWKVVLQKAAQEIAREV